MPFYTYDYERLSRAAARLREERWRCHAPIEAFAVTEDDGTVGARPPREPGRGGGERAPWRGTGVAGRPPRGTWTAGGVAGETARPSGGDEGSRWAEWADRAFRRDSRRYDGGFYLY